jgi:hypothetical protein
MRDCLFGPCQGYIASVIGNEPTLADRGRVVSATDPHGRNLGFLDPEPLLFHSNSSSVILTRLSGPRSGTSQKIWSGIEPGSSGSVGRNSDH